MNQVRTKSSVAERSSIARPPLAPAAIPHILDVLLHARKTEVLDVRWETPTIMSFRLQRPDRYHYKAGQFALLRLRTAAGPDFRPLSIASAPHEDYLEFSTRVGASAFKTKLMSLMPGDVVKVLRPLGSLPLDRDRPAVFVAGGIGVTPLRSLLLDALHGGFTHPIRMLYSNKSVDEIAYRIELERLTARHENLDITWALTTSRDVPDLPTVHNGRIDEDLLRRQVEELPESTFYLTGPSAMVVQMTETLSALGVTKKRIRRSLQTLPIDRKRQAPNG